MVGTLIRQLRIERNYSQSGLARGICAPSYLSKIEQGQADAGPEILEKLFAALGVEYCQDEALLQQAEDWLARYLEARDQRSVEQAAADWLDHRLEQLRCSRLNLWMGIYHLCRMLDASDRTSAKQLLNSLKRMEVQMDSKQQYRYFLCAAEMAEDPSEALQLIEQAANRCNCAHIQWEKSYVCFHMGQYSRCMETAERAYSMAAEEGDLYVLMWSSFLYGSCCTDRDLALAEKYYRRAIRLSRNSFPQMEDMAAYNLGASYLECGKLEQARYWLERAGEVSGEIDHNFLLHQKRAIAYALQGQKETGLQELETARKLAESLTDWAFFGDMLTFAELLLQECSQTPEFEAVTRRLYDQAGAKWGFGFRKFYGRYLVDFYSSQRRYKDALAVMETLQEGIS